MKTLNYYKFDKFAKKKLIKFTLKHLDHPQIIRVFSLYLIMEQNFLEHSVRMLLWHPNTQEKLMLNIEL